MRVSRIDREAIRARMVLLAHEHNLDEIVPAQLSNDAILDFCFRHGVSIDWLVLGDLHGRQRMARGSYLPHDGARNRR